MGCKEHARHGSLLGVVMPLSDSSADFRSKQILIKHVCVWVCVCV